LWLCFGCIAEPRDACVTLYTPIPQHSTHADHNTNHSNNGNISGIDSLTYYMVDPQQYVQLVNFSGCGHTVSANHPVVRQLIIDSLVRSGGRRRRGLGVGSGSSRERGGSSCVLWVCGARSRKPFQCTTTTTTKNQNATRKKQQQQKVHWAEEYHVDGFRFDLASCLCRDAKGAPLPAPPLIREIAKHPVLSKKHLIAEPWDLGMYQVPPPACLPAPLAGCFWWMLVLS
jgi:hypothetical protein